jgi:hypothetical protein
LAVGYKADFIVLDANPFSDSSPFAAAGGAGSGGSGGSGGVSGAAATGGDSGMEGKGPRKGGVVHGGLPVVQQTYMDGICVYGCADVAE